MGTKKETKITYRGGEMHIEEVEIEDVIPQNVPVQATPATSAEAANAANPANPQTTEAEKPTSKPTNKQTQPTPANAATNTGAEAK